MREIAYDIEIIIWNRLVHSHAYKKMETLNKTFHLSMRLSGHTSRGSRGRRLKIFRK